MGGMGGMGMGKGAGKSRRIPRFHSFQFILFSIMNV